MTISFRDSVEASFDTEYSRSEPNFVNHSSHRKFGNGNLCAQTCDGWPNNLVPRGRNPFGQHQGSKCCAKI